MTTVASYEFELFESAARTVGVTGDIVETIPIQKKGDDDYNPGAKLYLDISLVTGTDPTLTISIVATVGGATFNIGAFTEQTTVGQEVIDIANCPDKIKAVAVIGGTNTPTFTFSTHVTR